MCVTFGDSFAEVKVLYSWTVMELLQGGGLLMLRLLAETKTLSGRYQRIASTSELDYGLRISTVHI